MGRVQCDEYVGYVLGRNLFQPAAQQVERVQSEGYGSVPGGLKAVGLHLHDSARAEGRPQPPSP